MRLFIGDYWAEDHHDVELMDAAGKMLAKARLPEGGGRDGPAALADWSGGPGESHRAPPERSVSLSVHSALLIAFRRACVPRSSARTAWALDRGARTTMP